MILQIWMGLFIVNVFWLTSAFNEPLLLLKQIKKIKVCPYFSKQNMICAKLSVFNMSVLRLKGKKEEIKTSEPVYRQAVCGCEWFWQTVRTATPRSSRRPATFTNPQKHSGFDFKPSCKKRENFTGRHLLTRPDHQTAPVACRALMGPFCNISNPQSLGFKA